MTVILRPYQFADKTRIYAAWEHGHQCVLFRADTGYGKTAVLANIIEEHKGASAVIAHRYELVSQISLMLARYGVRHNIIASKKDCKAISAVHVKETGYNYYDPTARVAVASVDTLIRRDNLQVWASQVTRVIVDEGHHVVLDNKWHKAIQIFTNPLLKILLPTATPKRADGKGLGRHSDGIADVMTEGPAMRWLIDEGYLTNYKLATVNSHIEELLGKVAESGDWSISQLRAASEKSTIIGDIVKTYLAYAAQRLAIVFCSDVKTAQEQLAAFRAAGILAELITGDTDPDVRRTAINKLKTRQIHVMLAVDIVSEGFDLPAVEVGIFGRATASLIIYMQQCGRILRPADTPQYKAATTREERLAAIAASSKPYALYIDHVGNFNRHKAPDLPRVWTLDRQEKRSNGGSGAIPTRTCLNIFCGKPYERFYTQCPYCGTLPPPPAGRSSPAMVDGDMVLLEGEMLDALRGRITEFDMPLEDYRAQLAASGLPGKFIMRNVKARSAAQDAQKALRLIMGEFGGWYHTAGLKDGEIQKLFFLRFGVDVMTAQTLTTDDAYVLMNKIALDLGSK